jgi:hypothetical protein
VRALTVFDGCLVASGARDAVFDCADSSKTKEIAALLDARAPGLSVEDRFAYATAPVAHRESDMMDMFLSWAGAHASSGSATGSDAPPTFLESVSDDVDIREAEVLLRACTLWLFLDLKFPLAYGHADEVLDAREKLADVVASRLASSEALAGGARPGFEAQQKQLAAQAALAVGSGRGGRGRGSGPADDSLGTIFGDLIGGV